MTICICLCLVQASLSPSLSSRTVPPRESFYRDENRPGTETLAAYVSLVWHLRQKVVLILRAFFWRGWDILELSLLSAGFAMPRGFLHVAQGLLYSVGFMIG